MKAAFYERTENPDTIEITLNLEDIQHDTEIIVLAKNGVFVSSLEPVIPELKEETPNA